MERLTYVDVFRGIAILFMIFFHFIHTLAPVNVYTDFPYYLEGVGMFVFPPPPFLFLFVSGMSAYLFVTKRRNEGFAAVETVKRVAVRYGKYVLISLPFTLLVFDLGTWLGWEEALQGIGLTIIILAGIYAVRRIDLVEGILLMLAAAFVQANRHALDSLLSPLATGTSLDVAGAVVFNAFAGGYFSVTSLLPFAVGGLLAIRILYEEEDPGKMLVLGTGLTVTALLLTMQGFTLGFYARDIPIGLFGAGTSMLIYYAVYRVHARFPGGMFDVLARSGRAAFLIYLWTWTLIIKGAQVVGVAGTVPHLEAWLVSGVLTAGSMLAGARYVTYRDANGPVMGVAWRRVRPVLRRARV